MRRMLLISASRSPAGNSETAATRVAGAVIREQGLPGLRQREADAPAVSRVAARDQKPGGGEGLDRLRGGAARRAVVARKGGRRARERVGAGHVAQCRPLCCAQAGRRFHPGSVVARAGETCQMHDQIGGEFRIRLADHLSGGVRAFDGAGWYLRRLGHGSTVSFRYHIDKPCISSNVTLVRYRADRENRGCRLQADCFLGRCGAGSW